MRNKVKFAVIALCYCPLANAQNSNTEQNQAKTLDENAFTFTEAQLGEDDNMSQNITILNSNTNAYASQVGYQFSPVRFRYRAFNQKFNEVYVNGNPMNDMETGQFRFSTVGGLNRLTRNVDFALPFEGNNFSMSAMGGSNNYDFRAGNMQQGHYLSLAGANRNYTARAMYTYGSGFNAKGWAFAAGATYRWAHEGYVEGTFYNSLSYFFGVEKKWKAGHSLSFTTWGNPTERANQGASTDEAYWLANDYYYNPYWGYQNGHKRNSRVVNDYSPSAILTWDWDINDNTKLVTSFFGKYGMYKSTKLNYNNSDNPQPDYWKNMPSSYFDVWNTSDNRYRTAQALADWNTAADWWRIKENRQINWDRLYYANKQLGEEGKDLMYYVQAKHNDNLMFSLSSSLNHTIDKTKKISAGFSLGQNRGSHYQTLQDMLGGLSFHNINTYAIGTYSPNDPRVQYDLNTMGTEGKGKLVYEGDVFGYDYDLMVRRAMGWANYTETFHRLHYTVSAKLGYDNMYRKGYMRNGLYADNSYGKSKEANFLSGGGKFNGNYDFGKGHTMLLGLGYEQKAPQASVSFVSPELNNDFVTDLQSEKVFSSELGYQYDGNILHLNISGYYSYLKDVTEWQQYYYDNENSFVYESLTGINKAYYGVEAGAKVKLTDFLTFKALGTISDAKYLTNAHSTYLVSTKATKEEATVHSENMRENGTPLTATSLGLDFHMSGWYINLDANWYDRIYLSFNPSSRYEEALIATNSVDNDGNLIVPSQSKGHGGWMLDGSIGKSIRLKKGSLNFNLMVTNILNNRHIVSGGYEQGRSDYTKGANDTYNERAYKFSKNDKKYYVFGTNGMFQVSYRF